MSTMNQDCSPLCGRTVCTTSRSWYRTHERRITTHSGHVCGRGLHARCCRCTHHTPCVPRRGTFRYRRYPCDHLPYVDANGLWFGPAMDGDSDCYEHVFHHNHGTASGCNHSGNRIHGRRDGPRVTFMPRGDSHSRGWSILADTPGALYLRVGSRLDATHGSLFQRGCAPRSRSAPSQQAPRGASDDAWQVGWAIRQYATPTARPWYSDALARSIAPSLRPLTST